MNNVLLIFFLDRISVKLTFNLHKNVKNSYRYKEQCTYREHIILGKKISRLFNVLNSYGTIPNIFHNIFYLRRQCQFCCTRALCIRAHIRLKSMPDYRITTDKKKFERLNVLIPGFVRRYLCNIQIMRS